MFFRNRIIETVSIMVYKVDECSVTDSFRNLNTLFNKIS